MHAADLAMHAMCAEHLAADCQGVEVMVSHVHAGQAMQTVASEVRMPTDAAGLKLRIATRSGAGVIDAPGASPIAMPVPDLSQALAVFARVAAIAFGLGLVLRWRMGPGLVDAQTDAATTALPATPPWLALVPSLASLALRALAAVTALGLAVLVLLIVIRLRIAHAMIVVGAGGIVTLNGRDIFLSQLKTLADGPLAISDLSVGPMRAAMGYLSTEAGRSRHLRRAANAGLGWMRSGAAMSASVLFLVTIAIHVRRLFETGPAGTRVDADELRAPSSSSSSWSAAASRRPWPSRWWPPRSRRWPS